MMIDDDERLAPRVTALLRRAVPESLRIVVAAVRGCRAPAIYDNIRAVDVGGQ